MRFNFIDCMIRQVIIAVLFFYPVTGLLSDGLSINAMGGKPYQTPGSIDVSVMKLTQILPRNTIIVPAKGRDRILAAILLEPVSEYGLIRYNRYRLVPQIGDYYPIFRLSIPEKLDMVPYLKKW